MAIYLSPGVFIEEVASQTSVIQSVSTSTMGGAGFTPQGPTDVATLVTSWEQYQQVFGAFTRYSFLPHNTAAFYANGGTRAYISRVLPSDAVKATGAIQSCEYDQSIEAGDGVTATFTRTATTTLLHVHHGAAPVVGSSIAWRWRSIGSAATNVPCKKRDGTTTLVGDGALTKFDGRLDPADFSGASAGLFDTHLRPTDPILDVVTSGVGGVDVTVEWNTHAKKITFAAAAPGPIVTGTSTDGATGEFDRRTGIFSISIDVAPLVGNITASYSKATANKTITDDGAGNLVGTAITAGTITYATGAYTFTCGVGSLPHNGAMVVADYEINAWSLSPISKGVWANSLRIMLEGSADSFDAANSTYGFWDVAVQQQDSSGTWQVMEAFEELSLTDPTSSMYFPDVLNELSGFVRVNIPGGDESAGQLSGEARTEILAGGDETVTGQVVTGKMFGGPLAQRAIEITYMGLTSGETKTITDNGYGVFIGAVDPAYTSSVVIEGITVLPNGVDYDSGAYNVKLAEPVVAGSLVIAEYCSAPAEGEHFEVFGDTSKGYIAGADGTFTSSTYGRNQFTSPALAANTLGVYAFNRVDEILQIVVPDFAGDVVVSGDLLDYAASRASRACGGDRFIILTVPKGSTPQRAVDWYRYTFGRNSSYAAIYWPWIKVADPLANNRPLLIPPLGHIAGVYARTDATKNVGKAPAGTVDGQLNYLIGLEYLSTHGERDLVYPNRINPIISTPQTGTCVWGCRTITADPQWINVNARRLFMFLEKSVYNSTQWIVFENNGAGLWGKISLNLNSFMQSLYMDGYFAGNSPSEAYFVKCDSKNNTAATINAGQTIVDIGAAPNKPAEFVRFRFQQMSLT